MRKAMVLVFGLLVSQAWAQDEYLKKSVVKIFTVMKPADYYQPWQMGYQQQGVGSGLILEGNVILTNAHVVSDQVHLQVLKAGATRKVTAHVKFVGHDCELAMLTVDDPDFFKGTLPVKFGEMPHQRDKVAAYGFPAGGEELSITEGVVSRIEMQSYVHSQRSLLTIQTDAAINPGNSGGPVFKEGKFIGISFQSFSGTRVENTGYIIPLPVIHHFLKDIADGHYDGVPSIGLYTQKMENPSLRDYYKMPKGEEGLIVTKVVYGSPADGLVKEGDVLTQFAGVKIAGNGTIPFEDSGRVFFANLLTRYQIGEKAGLELLRDGKRLNVEITFKDFEALVARPQYDVRPSYFVYAGLVFTPLSFNYLKVWGWNDVSSRFKYLFEGGLPSADKHQIVFINQVLPNDVNSGYHRLSQVVVDRINGENISEMKDVITALKKPQGGFHIIETDSFFGDPDSAASKIVLSAEKCEAANKDILQAFAIPSDRSEDLK
jgi:S1-C subfamily serine protease